MTNNALLIYNQLVASGLTHAGALGLMGNWMAESGLEPNRLQSDFTTGRTHSKAYTEDVTSGKIGKTQFARDSKGYGLAQWTYYTRKEALYDFWKNSGSALDDVRMQVKFALHELSTEGEYAGLWSFLKTTEDIRTAADKVCRLYELPYFNNVDARFQFAKQLEAELSSIPKEPGEAGLSGQGGAAEGASFPVAAGKRDDPELGPTFWPPRMVDKNMSGPDVAALQGLLYARGLYGSNLDGQFGDALDTAVRSFQSAHALDIDGVVGPITWAALLQR